MSFGAALHTLVLEPSRFETEYVMLPDDAPPKPNKRQIAAKKPSTETLAAISWWDEWSVGHGGKIQICENGDWDRLHWISDAIRAHPFASILLAPEDGQAEISIAWQDPDTGAYCRARPDFLNEAHALCVDLKTCQDSSMGAFAKACANYTYHIQAAFYLSGLAAVKQPHDKFIFVAVEHEPPYAVACYELAPDDLALGRTLYRKALRIYQTCLETDTWPSYPEEVRILELPQWARFVPLT